MRKISKPKITAVDLFCGAGGLTQGLEKAGVDVRVGVDVDSHCEYPYSHNNNAKFINKSVADISTEDLFPYLKKKGALLLAGCAPCQTFSTYNQKASSNDDRWWLLLEFSRLIKELKPDLVTMENVPGLVDQDVFKVFVTEIEGMGFKVSYKVVNCADYGLPQRRRRLVLLASRYAQPALLSPQEFTSRTRRTVREAIMNLPPIDAGGYCERDPLHQSASLSSLNLRRIKISKPGGTWKDWPESLRLKCHKRSTGATYSGVYGRMEADAPAPTVTTQFYGFGNGRFGHPTQNRALSLREGALLQGFPKSYEFVPRGVDVSKTHVGRLIGNAVPVTLGKLIGKSLLAHMSAAE